MVSQAVYCPNCDRQVSAKEINIASMMAVCSTCDHVFSIDVPKGHTDGDSIPDMDTTPSRPSGLIHDTGLSGELFIKRSWFHPMVWGLLFFCIAWDGFLVFWYSMAIFGPADKGAMGWLMILFPICHVAVGVGLTYFVVASFLNRTEILLTFDSLYVRHRPVPWKGNRSLRRDEIHEIELEFGGMQQNTGGATSGLQMIVSVHHVDGRQVVLLTGIPKAQAEYIAWHLAHELKVRLVRKDNLNGLPTVQIPGWMRGFLPVNRR